MKGEFVTLLNTDGLVRYCPNWLTDEESNNLFQTLAHSIEWKHEEVVFFGKKHVLPRLVAWYGAQPFQYTYSGNTWNAQAWTDELQWLKDKLENETGEMFNSCLLNFYHNGSESMGWHSDNEKSLVQHAPIASISLGAARTFQFKHRTNKGKVAIELENGSLLLMEKETQDCWLHALPKRLKVTEPRINLTFRKMR
jgi:alkylated DNA repair dioxygenase AlkB